MQVVKTVKKLNVKIFKWDAGDRRKWNQKKNVKKFEQ